MTTVNIHKAKTHLSRLISEAAAGHEVVIARGGRPAARLMPIETAKPYTQVYLWWLARSRRLSAAGRAAIRRAYAVFVSAVPLWEAAEKVVMGKLDADVAARAKSRYLVSQLRYTGIGHAGK